MATWTTRRVVAALAGVALLGGLLGAVLVRLTVPDAGTRPLTTSPNQGTCVATAVAEKVLPSVVTIRAQNGPSSGVGSGQIVRPGGYILTNDHVIAPAGDAGEISVRYADGSTVEATVVGRDPLTDLAVVRAADEAEDRPLIPIGASASLRVGQPVIALGAPLGLYGTVTAGVVSALDRYVLVPAAGGGSHHLLDAIQTDASINPGNSGGPLVDCAGRLVGVNSANATPPDSAGQVGGGNVGLGFAIPVDLAEPLAEQLIASGRVDHPTFGLQAQTIPDFVAQEAGLPPGLFVTEVDAGGPADQAGIRVGDVITEIDGQPAQSVAVLEKSALTREAGDTVEVTVVRDGNQVAATVTLGPSA
jgi:putative serine protease PepD